MFPDNSPVIWLAIPVAFAVRLPSLPVVKSVV